MKLSQISLSIVTLRGLGKTKIGRVLASILALPLLLFLKLFNQINPYLFYASIGFVLFISIGSILFSIKNLSPEDKDCIVWDRIFGLMLAFIYIPLRFKLMVFGVIFFSILRFSFWGMQDKLTGLSGMFVSSFVSGLIVNFLLRFMLWIVY